MHNSGLAFNMILQKIRYTPRRIIHAQDFLPQSFTQLYFSIVASTFFSLFKIFLLSLFAVNSA